MMLGLGAFIPGLGVLAGIGSLAAGASGAYASTVATSLTPIIESLFPIKSFLASNKVSKVRIKITTYYDSFMEAEYPTQIQLEGFLINSGWVLVS